MSKTVNPPPSRHYHHGDLHAVLLREGAALLNENGIEALSLRKLAERCDVSRMAPYHHFKDKHQLLCELAQEGFLALDQLLKQLDLRADADRESELLRFVLAYLHFACDQPERYNLMFGREIWKLSQPTSALRDVAFRTFRLYVKTLLALFGTRLSPGDNKPLRQAQASWATLHGLCRLLIDGIYIHRADMEEVATEAVRLMQLRTPSPR